MTAADRVFRSKGIEGATVHDITGSADIAYGSFYNHFRSIDELVAALAERSLQKAAAITGQILEACDTVELLPCAGARVVMRTLGQDPAVRWLLGRPQVLVETFNKTALPFMQAAERDAVANGQLRPAGGHEFWLQVFPWMLISELIALARTGDCGFHEERFARASLRLLGVDDSHAETLLTRSEALVAEHIAPANSAGASRRPRASRAAEPQARGTQ